MKDADTLAKLVAMTILKAAAKAKARYLRIGRTGMASRLPASP